MEKNGLPINPKKCAFEVSKIDFLGYIIQNGRLEMDPEKVEGLRGWPPPKDLTDLRKFLGFGNFYRRFIHHYSDLARPLHNLLKKDTPFTWTKECNQAFPMLKEKFTSYPVLRMPDSTKPFQIEADASKYASGAVLTQLDDKGARHPVCFLSKTFDQAQRNYEIYDRELLAIIRALEEWRYFIMGSSFKTTIYSDHQNLLYWKNPQKLSPRQARWFLTLSKYDFEIKHLPGSKMIQSDALSRRPDYCQDNEEQEDVVMLPEELFVDLIDTELQKKILNAEQKDEEAEDAIRLLLEDAKDEIQKDLEDWTLETREGKHMLFRQGKAYVPKDTELRRQIVRNHHEAPTIGHPGEIGTFNAVQEHYWWPGMRKFIKEFVQGCAECQQYKINRHPIKPTLLPIPGPISDRPFTQLSMDFITDLPPSNGYDSIMAVVDHGLTKGVILEPCNKTITAEQTAEIFLRRVFANFGLPDKVISDRGPQFVSKVFRDLLERLKIEPSLSTAFHPQTDGSTERVNQEIEAYLSIYCSANPSTWSEALPLLQFVHNSRNHADRTSTPFELIMGTQPRALPEVFEKSSFPTNEKRFKHLDRSRNEALAAHELGRNRMIERSAREWKPFKKGDKVWLEARNLKLPYKSKKLAPRRQGPFEIEEEIGLRAYRLKLPEGWKIHNVFHISLLSPFKTTDTHGPSFPEPPPDEIEGEEEYEVEGIINHRPIRTGGMQYLVKWLGYNEKQWLPERELSNAQEYLERYKKANNLP
ncbi:hypothetical protein NMY22_g11070 [Coprinellus aureogranulatus]|nr:hypothetical protein NMY22_g11070 [Coprinellus aureogranulatus]